jgi:hypothetical protein
VSARVRLALWALLALPGLWQLGLLLYTVLRRFAYPFDLEWMEGGLLAHAARLAEGQSIYPPPSIEFIPYLYTPLYPALLALLGGVFGLSYQLGRAISLASILGVVALMVVALRRSARAARSGPDACPAAGPAAHMASWTGASLAAGFFAATYPWVEGWYDLVRADILFLPMALGGLVVLDGRARAGTGLRGQLGVAVAAALLALSFFCKQIGIFYVATGGALLLVWNWRRVPVYVVTAGAIGLGGTAIINHRTDGWFWSYVYEVPRGHDFNMDRFYASFGNILGHFPLLTAAIALGLVAVLATWAVTRRRPAGGDPFLLWCFVFAVSCVVGAIGWGKQWAHFNHYMPAMTTGALAAGASLPALAGCATVWWRERIWASHAVPAAVAALLGLQLLLRPWDPRPFIPEQRDVAAGHAFIDHLRALVARGEVYVPYHPWYARMAGQKELQAHRMGLMDLGWGNRWKVTGVREAFRDHRFAAVILDDRPVGWELAGLAQHYRLDERLPAHMRPRLFTGAKVVPDTVWVPIDTGVPPGATVIFDFEQGHLRGWDSEGAAWGKRPERRPVPGQGHVSGYRGRAFVTSAHGGDSATGVLTSPPFRITGDRLTFRMSGGADESLRIELVTADGTTARTAVNESHGDSESDATRMREITWDVRELRGQEARLVLVDQATSARGHLNADDFLLWPE